MATQPQPPISSGPLAGLIKLKPGVLTASKGSQPEDGGEDVGADSGDDSGLNVGMLKRKWEAPPASNTISSKKSAREESPVPLDANGEPVEVVPGKSELVAGDLHVVKQQVGQLHSSFGAIVQAEQAVLAGSNRDHEDIRKVTPILENLSHGQLLVNSVIASDQHGNSISGRRAGADPSGFGGQSHLIPTGMLASLPLGTPDFKTTCSTTELHIIPSHAGWFSWTKIHTLEKRGLPEFFNGKTPGKTPNLYVDYRNIILNRYRNNVKKMITVADVQDLLVDLDLKTIARVLEFFEHWGLINYQAPAVFRPLWQSPVLSLDSDMVGMLCALPSKGSSLYEFDSLRAPVTKPGYVISKSADVAISELLALPEGLEVEYHCKSCFTDYSKQRYHCHKQADVDVCCDCYNDGKFGLDMVSTDFTRMDSTEDEIRNGVGWTDLETLLLLEALEMYGENWNEIAEHVATKSKAQCILHFIRLPVEDPFLEDMETRGTTLTVPAPPRVSQTNNTGQGEQTGQEKANKLSESNAHGPSTEPGGETSNFLQAPPSSFVAFADARNPVMAQVAFLAAMVGPRVAAAAAQAALATLTQKDPGPRLAATTAIVMDPPWRPPPSAVQLPVRLLLADSEVRSPSIANQPTTAEVSSVGGTSVSGQEIVMAVKPVGAGDSSSLVNGQSDMVEEVLATAHIKHAATSAMAAAAVKAKLLADQEEREIQRLVTIVIEHQLKKLELKLKTFNDLEIMLSKECESVERARQKIHSEHARMVATRLGTAPAGSANPPIHEAGSTGSRLAGYCPYVPGGQATQILTPGTAASYQGKNPLGSGTSPSMQGFARPMTAGAMTARSQGQFMRPRMMGGATPQSAGQTAMPHSTLTTPPQTPGRPP